MVLLGTHVSYNLELGDIIYRCTLLFPSLTIYFLLVRGKPPDIELTSIWDFHFSHKNIICEIRTLVSCGGGQRPVDGLRQQPCSHHPTARVGHSRGFHRHLDLIRGTKTIARYTHVDDSVE